jgi:hypothetical protein
MKGWLDKYGKEINANEGYSSAPDNWEGEGYSTKGRNYSPAWGGQFAMGGSLPGSVGFTYARTNSPAPSEGPYAKKTLPSAQNGQEMSFYQHGLDWKPRNISRDGSEVPKNQNAQYVLPRYNMPRVASESTSTGVTSLQRLPETERQIDVAKKIAKQPQIKQGRKNTLDDDRRRYQLNKQLALDNDLLFNYKTGDIAKLNDPTAKGDNWGRVSTPEIVKTAAFTTPSGQDYGAGEAGANFFVNAMPGFAPITAIGRGTQFVLGQNPYGFNTNSISSNILPTLGLLGDVAGIGSFKILPGANQVLSAPGKAIAQSMESGLLSKLRPKPTSISSSVENVGNKFKSEIDWGAWNPETPNYPELINEYNAIEESTKNAGTWMTQPRDYSIFSETDEMMLEGLKDKLEKGILTPSQVEVVQRSIPRLENQKIQSTIFQGTPEQFIQQQSSHFKKAFPQGFEKTYRGTYGEMNTENLFKNYPEGRGIFTGDIETGKHYTGDKGKLFELFHPKSSNSYNIDVKGRSWREVPTESLPGMESKKTFLGKPVADTDDIATWAEKNNVDYVTMKNIFDGVDAKYSRIVNNKPGNFLKSTTGNVGFFDMTNPNIYKGLVPAGIVGAAALEQKKQGGVIKDNMGYWNPDNWGKVVEIDSPNITMKPHPITGQEVPPLIGISDEGDVQYMEPGKDYKFKGKKVKEYPVAQKGKKVSIDGKEYDTTSEEYKDMLDEGVVGTMKDGVFYGNKSDLRPVVIASSKDKDTQEFYNKLKEGSLNDYESLIELGQKYGPAPHVTMLDKPGLFSSKYTNNENEVRPSYNPFTQRMYLGKNNSDLREGYLSELAHHKQLMEKGATDFILRGAKLLPRIIKNKIDPTKQGYEEEYSIPGSIENEAHEDIEYKLKQELYDLYWKKRAEGDYYRSPGHLYFSKPDTKFKKGGWLDKYN